MIWIALEVEAGNFISVISEQEDALNELIGSVISVLGAQFFTKGDTNPDVLDSD